MSFRLNSVVPWGRNFEEYRQMFMLSDSDLSGKIADFGGGPAGFNCEAAEKGFSVTSFDPIYQFSKAEIENRIEETRTTVMRQMEENFDNYNWNRFKSLDELEAARMNAMRLFLTDFERGRTENRYISHELPNRLPVEDGAFDIGLSSHFLLMYTDLGYDFHIRAITEMLRACREVRIFPIVDLDANNTELSARVIKHFNGRCFVEIRKTDYDFQKGDNLLLILKNPA